MCIKTTEEQRCGSVNVSRYSDVFGQGVSHQTGGYFDALISMGDLLAEGLEKVESAVDAYFQDIFDAGIETNGAKIRGAREKLTSQSNLMKRCMAELDTVSALASCVKVREEVLEEMLSLWEGRVCRLSEVAESVARRIAESDGEVERLDDERRELKVEMKTISENAFEEKQELKRMCEILISADKEMAKLERKWRKREQVESDVERELDELTAKAKDLRLEESRLRTKVMQVANLAHVIHEEGEGVEEERAKIEQQVSVAEAELKNRKENLDGEMRVCGEIEREGESIRSEMEKIQSELSLMGTSLVANSKSKQDLEEQRRLVQESVDATKEQLEKANEELTPIKERKEWLEQVIGENDALIAEVQSEISVLENDFEIEMKRKSELDAQGSVRDALVSTIEGLDSEIAQTQDHLKTLKYKLVCVSQEFGRQTLVPTFSTPKIRSRDAPVSPTITGMVPSKLFPNCMIATDGDKKGDSQPMPHGKRTL